MNKQYVEALLENNFIEFNTIGFFQDIFKTDYVWKILDFEYIPHNNFWKKHQMNNEIKFVMNEINNNKIENPLVISWKNLIYILKSSAQIINTFIYVFENNSELLEFEIGDGGWVAITTSNEYIIEKFNYWVDEMKSRSGV